MNRTPPLNVPPLSLPTPSAPLRRKPRPPADPERAFPAPHARPLPCAVPHPARLPPFSPSRPALFAALLLSVSALGLDCAQLEVTSSADAGTVPALTTVSSVSPEPGNAAPDATFEVTFSAPMDASLLLSDVARSETVVLVAQSNAQVMAAALAHARLTAAEEALLVSAQATLGAAAQTISLTPSAPLAAGSYALLVASRLKDAAGGKLAGDGFEFDYAVASKPAPPTLLDPVAGSSAPVNLARVRVLFGEGDRGGLVSLTGPSGLIAAAVAPAAPGEAAIELCPDAPCAALVAGQQYALALDGTPVPGASFTAESCARAQAPALFASALVPRDDSAQLTLSLDWPAHVTLQLSSPAPASDGGSSSSTADAGAPGFACDGGSCTETLSTFASCAPTSCGDITSASCNAQLALTSLTPSTGYTAQLALEDDEGHVTELPPLEFTTLSTLPSASLEEIMAAPPLPEPRDEGEYVELQNSGAGAIDLSQLALQGPDGVVRPLLGATPPSPILLEPGGYALAVGASFDATRYAIPAGVPILRASTQRLLAHGLADDSPPSISLLSIGAGADAGAPAVLSNFPGGAFHCPDGASLDRVHPAPEAGQPTFACGPVGGFPGAAP